MNIAKYLGLTKIQIFGLSRKNCPPENFYPRIKIFSNCAKKIVSATLKVFVHLDMQTMSEAFLDVFNATKCFS